MLPVTQVKADSNETLIKLTDKVTINKEDKQWVANLPKIKFVTVQAPPMSTLASDNVAQKGIAIDVLNFIANDLGLKFTLINNSNVSLGNNIKMVQNGTLDAFVPLSMNLEREKLGLFSKPFYSSVYAIITGENNNYYIKDLKDLKNYKVGFFKGFVLENQLRQIVPEENLYPITSNKEDDLYDALYDNKIDVAIHNKDMFVEHKYSHRRFDLKVIYTLYEHPRNYRFYFNKNDVNQKLVKIFDRYLDVMDVSGSYNIHKTGEKKLIQEYIGHKNKQLAFRLFLFFVVLIAAIIFFFYRKNLIITQELYKANQKLQSLYGTDSLTGLANRNMLNKTLEKEHSRYIHTNSNLSLLFIDADFFKKINDTYGHNVGDQYLIKIAGALTKSMHESSGFTARYGGEEFICLIPNSNHQQAIAIAQQIQKEIVLLGLNNPASETKLQTVSIGIVTLAKEKMSVKDLISCADAQLYKAKRTGRNKICDVIV